MFRNYEEAIWKSFVLDLRSIRVSNLRIVGRIFP